MAFPSSGFLEYYPWTCLWFMHKFLQISDKFNGMFWPQYAGESQLDEITRVFNEVCCLAWKRRRNSPLWESKGVWFSKPRCSSGGTTLQPWQLLSIEIWYMLIVLPWQLLMRSGRTPEEALMILVPEAYKKHPTLMIKYPEVSGDTCVVYHFSSQDTFYYIF